MLWVTVLCMARYLGAFLASTHSIPVVSYTLSHETSKNVSRYCQMSPVGQNCSWLRTIGLWSFLHKSLTRTYIFSMLYTKYTNFLFIVPRLGYLYHYQDFTSPEISFPGPLQLVHSNHYSNKVSNCS